MLIRRANTVSQIKSIKVKSTNELKGRSFKVKNAIKL